MPGRAWTADEKIRIVLESMNTNISLAELCRKYNLSPGFFYHWKKFMEGGKLALAGQLRDPAKEKEAEINRLKRLIGELTIVNESMKEVLRGEGKK
jgi:transposase